MSKKDYSHLGMNKRLEIGAKYYQQRIVEELKKHGIEILLAEDFHTDAILKIDGFLNGDKTMPIQIKHRRTTQTNRNDIAFEVCRHHMLNQKVLDQLKNPHHQGRDYKGQSVIFYFLLNRDETVIHQICSKLLKDKIIESLEEHNVSNQNGFLLRKYTASNGVELIATKDNDRNSFTPRKVMAFIPVLEVTVKNYTIDSSPNSIL